MRDCGVAPAGDGEVRLVPDFEVATGKSLASAEDTGKFAGTRTVDMAAGTIAIAVYDITGVAAGEPTIHLSDPRASPSSPGTARRGRAPGAPRCSRRT